MFVGHYAAALALKPMRRAPPLAVLFLAAQLVDVGFFSLVLLNIEKFRIVPGITAMNPLDLYYMPYTHSLLGALIWAAGFGALLALLAPAGSRLAAGCIAAAAVASHWFLDFLVHRPDLGIFGDSHKVGLGLWNYPLLEMALESTITIAALVFYLRTTRAEGRTAVIALGAMIVVLALAQAINWFGPPPAPDGVVETSLTALLAYGVFVALAWWLDATRAPVGNTATAGGHK